MEPSSLTWLEKHRPTEVSSLLIPDHIRELIAGYVSNRTLPHLLIHGESGTGKTSAVGALVHALIPDKRQRPLQVLTMNASTERGIKTIRNRVKVFVSTKVEVPVDAFCFKVVVMDEADTLTDESQFALRRIIEDYSDSTRFILICNYIHHIIDPIQSRCCIVLFPQLTKNSKMCLIQNISSAEGLVLSDEERDEMSDENDIRKIIVRLSQYTPDTISVSEKKDELIGQSMSSRVSVAIHGWMNGPLAAPVDDYYMRLYYEIYEMVLFNYDPTVWIDVISSIVYDSPTFEDDKKRKMLEQITQVAIWINQRTNMKVAIVGLVLRLLSLSSE